MCIRDRLCTGTSLVVAGGKEIHKASIAVEVMHTETHQWSYGAALPSPRLYLSVAVCGDRIYMLGGKDGDFEHSPRRSVYTISLSALLQSCQKSSEKCNLWNRVADLPVTGSTCVSFHNQLLAIGGDDSSGKPITTIHMYNPTADKWEVISNMYTARSNCYAATLPDNQLIVVGGVTEQGKGTDSVEQAIMN